MGRHFSKVGATVILGPSNKKVRGPGPPAPSQVPTPMDVDWQKNVKKCHISQFLIIKILYRANFWCTFKNPEHASYGIIYQLLDSIVNLCTSTNYKT